jgi:prepilin-type processing-associated H-X9-DG protein
MKTLFPKGAAKAFTLIEALVVMAIIFVFVAMLLPTTYDKPIKAPRVQCMSNLRQVGIGLWMWSSDHTNNFPWQVLATNGGTMEASISGQASRHFNLLSDYLKDARVFVCPTDKAKHPATNYAGFGEQNVSYFINLDAGTHGPYFFLSGDRHLQTNGQPLKAGLFTLTTNCAIGWARELHARSSKDPGGNILFADGHVEWETKNLSSKFQRQGMVANQLAIP